MLYIRVKVAQALIAPSIDILLRDDPVGTRLQVEQRA